MAAVSGAPDELGPAMPLDASFDGPQDARDALPGSDTTDPVPGLRGDRATPRPIADGRAARPGRSAQDILERHGQEEPLTAVLPSLSWADQIAAALDDESDLRGLLRW